MLGSNKQHVAYTQQIHISTPQVFPEKPQPASISNCIYYYKCRHLIKISCNDKILSSKKLETSYMYFVICIFPIFQNQTSNWLHFLDVSYTQQIHISAQSIFLAKPRMAPTWNCIPSYKCSHLNRISCKDKILSSKKLGIIWAH